LLFGRGGDLSYSTDWGVLLLFERQVWVGLFSSFRVVEETLLLVDVVELFLLTSSEESEMVFLASVVDSVELG
jgi:hypothetical protein